MQERLIQAANKSDCDAESKRQIAYLLEQFDKINDSSEFGGESECSELTDGSESPSDDGYQGGDDEEDDTIVSITNCFLFCVYSIKNLIKMSSWWHLVKSYLFI